LPQAQLAQVLAKLPKQSDPRLLVGTNTADDAGVYLVRPDLALVQTVDILTPVVPDPFVFGQIAAANSLSDVYAMGGEPLTVLNVIGFPAAGNKDWLVEILRGAQEKVLEAGACVAGGHTFNDPEIKFGMAVTGTVDPNRIVTNARARPGDRLVLTKPLGTGTLSQALMTIDDVPRELLRQGVETMTLLNRDAARAMTRAGVQSATDVTGFGLIGHLQEMALASGIAVRLFANRIPLLPGVRELVEQGVLNPGIAMNEASFGRFVKTSVSGDLTARQQALLNLMYESQNSGGLLMAVSEASLEDLQSELERYRIRVESFGEFHEGTAGQVLIEF
jgi:selenide,water dikinase